MLKNEDVKAILFDIDDTLFDRKRAIEKVIHRIVQQLPELFSGMPEEKVIEAFHKADRMGLEEFNNGLSGDLVRDKRSKRFLRSLGLNEKFSDSVTTMYVNAYPSVNTTVKDAKFVVGMLADKYPLGIISNGFPDTQYHKLEGIGIRDFFKVSLLSEEIGIRKPDIAIFHKAAELLNVKPCECFFVGDSFDTDIIGAKRSGMRTCWFNQDGKRPISEEIKPDFEIDALSELLPYLGFDTISA